jgi:hypothetical protein
VIVAVTGSRDWAGPEQTFLLHAVLSVYLRDADADQLIVGDARGADMAARDYAKARRMSTTVYRADWAGKGPSAGPARNRRMLDQGSPDVLLAFKNKPWSRGTDGCIREALKRGIRTVITEVRG